MKRVFILTLLLVTAMLAAESWEELLTEGRGLYEKDKYEEAIEVFTRGIKLLPEGEGEVVYIERGRAYSELKKYEQSEEDCYRALKVNPDSAWAYNVIGHNYMEQKVYHKAITNFSKGILLDDNYSGLYHNRGYTYYLMGNYREALKDYNRALDINNSSNSLLSDRANIYYLLGRYELAKHDYSVLHKRKPQKSYYLKELAKVKMALYDYKGALEDLNKALELDPEYGYAYSLRGELYLKMGEREKALADYDKLFDIYEEGAYQYSERADYYSKIGEYEKALADYEKAHSLEPDNSAVLRELANYSRVLGNDKASQEYINKLLALELEDNYYHNIRKGYIFYQLLGDSKKALFYFNKGIKLKPYELYGIRARTHVMLEVEESRNEDIINSCRMMARLQPYNYYVFISNAELFSMLGMHDEALESVKKAIELNRGEPFNYFIYYNIAALARSSKEVDRAKELLKGVDSRYMQDGWTDKLAAYFTGELDEKGLLKAAGDDLPKQCEAYFYIAIAMIGKAPASEVRSYLEKVLATEVNYYYEYSTARYYLKNFHLIDKGEAK